MIIAKPAHTIPRILAEKLLGAPVQQTGRQTGVSGVAVRIAGQEVTGQRSTNLLLSQSSTVLPKKTTWQRTG